MIGAMLVAKLEWRAAVFAHHANNIEAKVRHLDGWFDECELLLDERMTLLEWPGGWQRRVRL